ncbi:hypothetical protein [Paraburkholderia youngii]|uniref:hypothetical protein n=1 Tax=Paraburkholderia youngii TaxID=2782701 RepID=UPI003D1EFE7F
MSTVLLVDDASRTCVRCNWRWKATATLPDIERALRMLRLSGVHDALETRVLQAQGTSIANAKARLAK